MSFMKPFIYLDHCYEVENERGETWYIPAHVVGTNYITDSNKEQLRMYMEGEPTTVAFHMNKYVARMSAPGYLDCTDWTMHETQAEAEAYLKEYYDADEDDWDEDEDETEA